MCFFDNDVLLNAVMHAASNRQVGALSPGQAAANMLGQFVGGERALLLLWQSNMAGNWLPCACRQYVRGAAVL